MKSIAVYSIKGGVGKTAAAVNLAYQFSHDRYRTVLIDLDPQGASGYYFKVRPKRNFKTSVLLNKKDSLVSYIRESDYPNLDILPSKMGYRHLDTDLDMMKNNRDILRKNLKEFDEEYDLAVLDCPPNITLLSENIFNAADTLLIPIIPTPLSERTFEQILDFFKKRDYHFNKIQAFFSMVEKRIKVHRETMEKLRDSYNSILETTVPKLSDIEKMGVYRKPVQCFAGSRPGSLAFKDLAAEILRKL